MAKKHRRNSSPRKHDNALSPKDRKERREAINRRRAHAVRHPVHRTCCHDPEVRKGLGAVTFTLALLTLVVGAVLTAVEVNDNDKKDKYPEMFAVIGPILIVLGIIFMAVGFVLTVPAVSSALLNCFSCDDPNSFCRENFPRLSHFVKPDETIFFNKSAMEALQNQPTKSAMKRPPKPEEYTRSRHESQSSDNVFVSPSVITNEKSKISFDVQSETEGSVRPGSKGVRFSDGDVGGVRESRAASVTSASSAVSLKHCKVHPKNGIFWVDDQGTSKNGSVPSVQTTTEL